MIAHTPGLWAAIPDSREDSEGDWYVLAPDEDVIAFGLSEPDAALIAAAPDMLKALKEIRQLIGIGDGFVSFGAACTLAHITDTAIAKAEAEAEAEAEGTS